MVNDVEFLKRRHLSRGRPRNCNAPGGPIGANGGSSGTGGGKPTYSTNSPMFHEVQQQNFNLHLHSVLGLCNSNSVTPPGAGGPDAIHHQTEGSLPLGNGTNMFPFFPPEQHSPPILPPPSQPNVPQPEVQKDDLSLHRWQVEKNISQNQPLHMRSPFGNSLVFDSFSMPPTNSNMSHIHDEHALNKELAATSGNAIIKDGPPPQMIEVSSKNVSNISAGRRDYNGNDEDVIKPMQMQHRRHLDSSNFLANNYAPPINLSQHQIVKHETMHS